MIVYRKNIIYILRTQLGIYSLLLIHPKMEYFTFAFVINKTKKNIQNLHFYIFLRPVATVTDKLPRDSLYHGVRIPITANHRAFPVYSGLDG